MSHNLTAEVSIEIKADAATVWKALTTTEIIKQYLFGTNTVTDWKVGSPIYFRGEWEGKTYEDKGTILEIQPEKLLKYSYWSSMAGTPDTPENYVNVTSKLSPNNNSTVLTIIQDGIKNEESRKHSEQNWKMVLEGLKRLVEQ